MKAMVAIIELDVSAYGTVQAEKLLRFFLEIFRKYTTFKGDMRGYIKYETDEDGR